MLSFFDTIHAISTLVATPLTSFQKAVMRRVLFSKDFLTVVLL